MLVVAHRGLHDTLPENTLGAFEAAVRAGADGVEMDVRLSRDGVPLVIHDLEVDHYLDGLAGYVFEHEASALRGRAIRTSPPSQPQAIPLLGEVLDALAGRTRLEIELKDPGPELVAAVAAEVRRCAAADGLEVTSFEPAALATLRRALSGAATCLLAQPSRPWQTPAMLAHRVAGQARLAGASAVSLHPSQLDPEALAPLRAAGLALRAWDVNDARAMESAARAGVASIDTDRPREMLALRDGGEASTRSA